MIFVSGQTLCLLCAVEGCMKGIFSGFLHFAHDKLIQGLHYDVAKMNGAVVFWLSLPGGGKTSFCDAAVQSRCLQK